MKKKYLLIILITTTSFNFLSAQSTSPSPYCVADFDDMLFAPVADAIFSVEFGTLTNVTNAQFALPHYVFYNTLSIPNLVKGSAYTLTAIFDVHGGAGYGIWIDYDHNNVFDASEKVSGTTVGTPLTISSSTTITTSVTIPTTAMTGTTRMRVRIVEDDNYTGGANGYSIMPCNASTSDTDVMDWGETEDYTINITLPVGINELSEVYNLIIYPNPVTTTLSLNQNVSDNLTYKIFNLAGQETQTGTINNSGKQISVSALSDGIYFLQLFDSNKSLGQQKFIKTTK